MAGTLLASRPLALVEAVVAVAAVALVLGVMASARANDARTAQQFGVVMVLPVVGLFVAQMAGQQLLHTGWIRPATAALWALATVLTWACVRVFDRETSLISMDATLLEWSVW